jgi:hypothetical protein
MTPEPPTKANTGDEQQAPAAQPPGRHILREPLKDTRAFRVRFAATAAGVLAVGAAVGLFLFLTQGSNQQAGQESPSRGVVCPYLQQAAVAYERGDSVAFNKTIERAVKIAEDTLQQSGQTFGEPEHIALELGLGPSKRAGQLLDLAKTACSQLGQWVSPSSLVSSAGATFAVAVHPRHPKESWPALHGPSVDTRRQEADWLV